MSSNLEENFYGFATWCSKFYFSSVGYRKPKKGWETLVYRFIREA